MEIENVKTIARKNYSIEAGDLKENDIIVISELYHLSKFQIISINYTKCKVKLELYGFSKREIINKVYDKKKTVNCTKFEIIEHEIKIIKQEELEKLKNIKNDFFEVKVNQILRHNNGNFPVIALYACDSCEFRGRCICGDEVQNAIKSLKSNYQIL